MGFVTFIGKFLLISSILFQAFLLYQDKKEADEFNKNLNTAIAQCSWLAPYKQELQQHLRLVVTGLLGSSALILLVSSWLLKLPTLLGLFTLLLVEHHGAWKQLLNFPASLQILDNVGLWHSLGVIGAVIYLLEAECGNSKKSNKAIPAQISTKQTSPEKTKAADKPDSKGKNKRN